MTEQDEAEARKRVPAWYTEIFPAGPNDGFFQKFGDHAASFVNRGRHQLVVSFDNLSDAGYPHYDISPWAEKFIREHGWSHLGIYAQGPSWFRDMRMIEFMEKLRDDGFFSRFERVSMIGTSMGGFGALTFSSLAPGATVVALSPQSSLHPDLVPWETRFGKGRKQNWDLPFSDAATQLSALNKAYVLYDPFEQNDVRHIARLPQERLVHLKGFGFSHKSAILLRRIGKLKFVMERAITGQLTESEFYRNIRERKNVYLYRVTMESHLEGRGRDSLIPGFREAFQTRRRQQAERKS